MTGAPRHASVRQRRPAEADEAGEADGGKAFPLRARPLPWIIDGMKGAGDGCSLSRRSEPSDAGCRGCDGDPLLRAWHRQATTPGSAEGRVGAAGPATGRDVLVLVTDLVTCD